ncbi:ABC transporter [Cutibacterium sp. WCA-380-WT-3A]|uniref:ABC transporter n=1 Tax=Cutibacterium porci TaxID=2605781 RepID=A0A7K0J9F6_9ACTN|nr:ABC transporter [Cutibacterium porci]MSS46601.1 ABC transporter [Cutibacterium porci]
MNTEQMLLSLTDLRDNLRQAQFPLDLPEAMTQAGLARRIAHQLNDYILPRLETIDAPLLAVVGGSTGAGKSTLVNSLVGRVVTQPGVIRPTTTSPVLVHHPDDALWFDGDRVLPTLVRSRVASNDASSLQLVAEPRIPRGLAILDAPDIDSVVARNRDLAAQLLQAADLWVFVTSAARYADAVPWDFLNDAQERHASVAVVCDRVPTEAMREVPADLGRLMTERGLADSPLFAIPETRTDAEGLLPVQAIAPVRFFLSSLAQDQQKRRDVIASTLSGAIGSVCERSLYVAGGLDAQKEAMSRLYQDAQSIMTESSRSIAAQSADGTLLRGEVIARWHEFVGTGEFMRAMEAKISWFRDRVVQVFTGTPPQAEKVSVAMESGLESLIIAEVQAGCERIESVWRADPVGRSLLEAGDEDVSRPSQEFNEAVPRMVRDWQGDVMELVAGEGMNKRSKARFMAFGVNGVSVALMLVVFAHTGGLSGAEAGIAGGSAIVAQRLLEALFGDDAVRRLAKVAKGQLDARVDGLLASEMARYQAILDALGVDPDVPARVRASIAEVRRAQDEPEPPSDNAAIRIRHRQPEVEASHAADMGQLRAGMPVLDAEVVEPAVTLDPEPRQEDR